MLQIQVILQLACTPAVWEPYIILQQCREAERVSDAFKQAL